MEIFAAILVGTVVMVAVMLILASMFDTDSIVAFVAFTIIAICAGIFAMLVAATNLTATEPPKNTDPRKGVVYLKDGGNKVCDGKTLVYREYGYTGGVAISTVPNSEECK